MTEASDVSRQDLSPAALSPTAGALAMQGHRRPILLTATCHRPELGRTS